jgi:2Fe-2S ferredoxin
VPTITVILADGTETTLRPVVGRSLMEALRDARIPDILAICGGCCICGTCHVHIDPAYLPRLPPMKPEEDEILEAAADRRENSRLSCQIPVDDSLEGLRLSPAAEGLAFAQVR